MLLALLMLVAGLLGGPLGGPAALVLEAERAIGTADTPKLSCEGGFESSGVALRDPARASMGGGALLLLIKGGGIPADGGGVLVTDRGAFGGGGVAVLASTFSAPGFLLIHRFSSGSYTKLLASPSFARIGLLGDSDGDGDSGFLEPPNQPEKPHPFFADC